MSEPIEIPTTNGPTILVDKEDESRVRQHQWWAVPQGRGQHRKLYAITRANKRLIRLHRYLLGIEDPRILVDHKDRNALNNQRSNLRVATHQQNAQNRKREVRNISGYKGVSWHAGSKKWRAIACRRESGRLRYYSLGLHKDPVQAAKAYDAKARELFGEFARLNFPLEGEQGC